MQTQSAMDHTLNSCKFYTDGKCELGYHNGKPHAGNCRACIAAGENNKEFADSRPKLTAQIKSVSLAIGRFAKSGFTTVEPEVLEQRLNICKSCDLWDPTAFLNTGRCKKCGCSTQAKLRMATEKCPIGKW